MLWYQNFLKDLAPKACTHGHQDVLTITPDFDQSKSGYTLDHPSLNEWYETQHFKPLELPVRLIALMQAQLLSSTIQNKCLRLLEEPQVDQLILWFKSSNQSLLPTIESRAMQLQLPLLNKRSARRSDDIESYLIEAIEDHELSGSLIELLHQAKWQEVAQIMQKESRLEQPLLNAILTFESHQPQGLKRKAQLLQNTKWFFEASTFGNANAERWTSLLSPYFPS